LYQRHDKTSYYLGLLYSSLSHAQLSIFSFWGRQAA
jgi:hypothetical protein